MSLLHLAIAGLRHYWRWHLGLLLGVALTAAVLGGSRIVGDSAKATLAKEAVARLGKVDFAFTGGDRFVTGELVDRVRAEFPESNFAGVVTAAGTASSQGGKRRANGLQVLGIDGEFWKMSPGGSAPPDLADLADDWGLALNEPLARLLEVKPGDLVLIRVEVPGAISKDAPLSGSTRNTVTLRKRVAAILDDDALGRFGLAASQSGARNVFLPLGAFQSLLQKEGQVNLVLAGGGSTLDPEPVMAAFEKHWSLEDLSLSLSEVASEPPAWQMASGRIFIDEGVEEAVAKVAPEASGVLTYLINRITGPDGKVTPYSMATAAELTSDSGGHVIVNRWLADDQNLKVGDPITMHYFVVAGSRELEERSHTLPVSAILEMDDPRMNAGWTPRFPGVSDADNCRDWDPGMPVDEDAIRDKDEDYWDTYKGTPKLFLPLATGEEIWSNRFGRRTAIRIPDPDGSFDPGTFRAALKRELKLDEAGFELRHVSAESAAAVESSLPLGQYLLAFGFFLIVTSLILAALLFLFTVEHRSGQIGLQLALGISPGRTRRALLLEAGCIAIDGALLGLVFAWLYAKATLWGLNRHWNEATGGLRIEPCINPVTLVGAFVTTVILALIVLYFASRSLFKVPPQTLLAGARSVQREQEKFRASRAGIWRRPAFWIGVLALLGGLGLLFSDAPPSQQIARFFGMGMALLVAGISAVALLMGAGESGRNPHPGGIWAVGRRNAVRRRGRSLAVCGMMAAGVFMVIALNAVRLDARDDAASKSSGTGGFEIAAESTLPVYQDLNTPTGRDEFALEPGDLPDVTVVPIRVRDGDDASCLSLTHAGRPRLLGIDPSNLADRFRFVEPKQEASWDLLDADPDGAVPAVADVNTAKYSLMIGVGDRLTYQDGSGRDFEIELVGLLHNTVTQGNLIISEANFIRHYPNAAGYRQFLIDAPPDQAEDVAGILTRQLGQRGFATEFAADRLNRFNAVQNTYMRIFSTLGGLGVLLGTLGLAIITARNMTERRSELGLMQALGFPRGDILKMVLGENWFLHLAGVGVGSAAALVAVWPELSKPGSPFPVVSVLLLLAAILLGGLLFCFLAARRALRGSLIEAVRSE